MLPHLREKEVARMQDCKIASKPTEKGEKEKSKNAQGAPLQPRSNRGRGKGKMGVRTWYSTFTMEMWVRMATHTGNPNFQGVGGSWKQQTKTAYYWRIRKKRERARESERERERVRESDRDREIETKEGGEPNKARHGPKLLEGLLAKT